MKEFIIACRHVFMLVYANEYMHLIFIYLSSLFLFIFFTTNFSFCFRRNIVCYFKQKNFTIISSICVVEFEVSIIAKWDIILSSNFHLREKYCLFKREENGSLHMAKSSQATKKECKTYRRSLYDPIKEAIFLESSPTDFL